jgi:hypothetical protein
VARSVLVATSLAVAALLHVAGLAGVTGVARADEGESPNGSQPLAYCARPLTLPTFTLAPELDGVLDKLSTKTAAMIYTQNPQTLNVTGALGASFGIFESIEVGAVVLPLQVLPTVVYGDPSVHVTLRFLKGSFELGGYFNTTFITHNAMDPLVLLPVFNENAGVLLQPGLLARVHGGGKFKLDVGALLPIQLGSGVHDLGLSVPVEVAFNIIDWFHLGASTGFGIVDFKDPSLSSSYIPLGFLAGFAFGRERPAVDLGLLFRWPQFVKPGASDMIGKIDTEDFQVGASLKVYIYLM